MAHVINVAPSIHDFIAARLAGPEPKVVLEVGAHRGEDTVKLAAIPGATVHAFEPDPDNAESLAAGVAPLPNVTVCRAAVAACDGEIYFHRSEWRGEQPWTCSGSIHAPTGHLSAYPDVEFGETIAVPAVTLDEYVKRCGIGRIDLIWADTQGAERDLIMGGRAALARTRWLYTEYCDPPLYAGQPTLAEILALLPGWRLLADWPSGEAFADALLENGALA